MATEPSIIYLIRALEVLAAHGELSITNLAMLSRMNHQRCDALLKWLLNAGYIQTRIFKKRSCISLTPAGREYARRLQEVREMTNFPVGRDD